MADLCRGLTGNTRKKYPGMLTVFCPVNRRMATPSPPKTAISREKAKVALESLSRARNSPPAMNYRYSRGCLLVGALLLAAPSIGCSRGKGGNRASADAPVGSPKLELPVKLHDFGKVTEGEKLVHVFEVKNTGSLPLTIDRVTTSCGCTSAVAKTKEIAPGGTGEIEVTFDTSARPGANRKSVTIFSNDSSTPRPQLEIAASVESLLALEPFFVRLNPEYGEEQIRESWLTGKLVDQAKLEVTKQDDDKDVSVELAEKSEGDKKIRGLRFKLKGKKVGYGSGRVTVSTGMEKPSQLILRYSWVVKGNVRLLPAQLYFDDKRPEAKERLLRVSSSKAGFKLKEVKVEAGPFKAKIEKSASASAAGSAGSPSTEQTYDVKVTMQEGTLPKPDASGELGKLILLSNDPLEPKKEVSLRLALGRPRGPMLGPNAAGLGVPPGGPPQPVLPPQPKGQSSQPAPQQPPPQQPPPT
jgi:hypothetical protein